MEVIRMKVKELLQVKLPLRKQQLLCHRRVLLQKMPTVVAITSVSVQEIPNYFRAFGFGYGTQQYSSEGSGSGIIVGENDDELLIATNNHVVSGATTLSVCFVGNDVVNAEEETVDMSGSDGDVNVEDAVSAKIKGTDESNDLAVVAVQKSDIPEDTLSQIKIAQLGNSDDLQVGEQVVAIGNALGYGQSVTSGWISALNRNISTDDGTSSSLIQTDAAINPGNSGGALLNMQGEVIGINSQIFSTSGGSMGLSFAIPINIATQVKDQILKNGKVTRGRIGVMIQSLTPELAKGFGLPEDTKGALVSRTDKDSPAAKAGLQSGDIIVGVDGTHVKNYSDIPRQISFAKPGSTVKLTVIRNKKEITVPVTVGVADGKTNTLKAGEESDTPKAEAKAGKLGVSVRPLTAKEAKKAGTSGLLVGNATGAAASAGIASGDVIVAVNGQPVKTVSDLSKAIEGKKQIAILVQRGGDQIYVPVNLDSSED